MEQVDRRAFMQKAGIATAAAGAVWAAPSVLGASTAFADGSLVNCAGLTWGTTPLYRNASGGSALGPNDTRPKNATGVAGGQNIFYARIPAVGTSLAITVKVTVQATPTRPGNGSGNNGGVNATVPYPGTNPGGLNGNLQYYAMNMNNQARDRGYSVTFEFLNAAGNASINVYNLEFTIYDIDNDTVVTGNSNNYEDKVWLSTAPSSPPIPGAHVTGSGTPGAPWKGSASANTGVIDQSGNVPVMYGGSISVATINYQSDRATANQNDIQYIGISNLKWCY